MAHHLADLLNEADNAEGTAKAAVEDRAVDLVLKLWLHRRALPEAVDPLGGLREVIQVLELLSPDANPWRRYSNPSSHAELLRETFHVLAKVVAMGALLVGRAEPTESSQEQVAGLSDEERHLLEMLEQWTPFVDDATKPDMYEVLARQPEQTDQLAVMDPEAKLPPNESEEKADLRRAILDELAQAKDSIEMLLERWSDADTQEESNDL